MKNHPKFRGFWQVLFSEYELSKEMMFEITGFHGRRSLIGRRTCTEKRRWKKKIYWVEKKKKKKIVLLLLSKKHSENQEKTVENALIF